MPMASDHGQRQALEHEPDPVSPQVVAREVAETAPDRGAAHVVDDGTRHVATLKPGDLRSQRPVDILEEGVEVLVERSDLAQGRASVDRGAAAGAEDRARLLVLPTVALAVTAAMSVSPPRQRVAGAVDHLAIAEVQQLAAG